MNVYALEGMIRDAVDGARVIAVVHDRRSARQALEVAVEVAGDRAAMVRRSAGLEQLHVDGSGWVRFVSRNSSLRGMCADSVFFDVGCDDHDVVSEAFPIVAVSGGKLVSA